MIAGSGSRSNDPARGLLPALMIDDQVEESGLDEIAKPAACGVGAAKIAVQEPQRELLEQLVSRVRIAYGGQEIAMDSAAVPFQQLALSVTSRGSSLAMCLTDQRPQRGDVAQPVLELMGGHAPIVAAL